ncbi:hypothetical protein MTO96_050330, partial [Rhipicephalus appendiculatus]
MSGGLPRSPSPSRGVKAACSRISFGRRAVTQALGQDSGGIKSGALSPTEQRTNYGILSVRVYPPGKDILVQKKKSWWVGGEVIPDSILEVLRKRPKFAMEPSLSAAEKITVS